MTKWRTTYKAVISYREIQFGNNLTSGCLIFTPLTQCWHWESWLSQIWQERLSGNKPLGREGDDRGGDGWMASLTWWTWAWASFGSWWWTGKPGVLQPMGSLSWTRLSDWTDKPLSKRIKQPNELVNIYFTFDINALLYSSIAILHLMYLHVKFFPVYRKNNRNIYHSVSMHRESIGSGNKRIQVLLY